MCSSGRDGRPRACAVLVRHLLAATWGIHRASARALAECGCKADWTQSCQFSPRLRDCKGGSERQHCPRRAPCVTGRVSPLGR
jgi:hypothetical protein